MRGIPRIQVAADESLVTRFSKSQEKSVTNEKGDPARMKERADEAELSRLRERAAELIERQRPDIYRRIHKLMLNQARRITDTEEILSTALRRVDHLIAQGAFEGTEDEQIYSAVHRVIERTIKEKARNARRLQAREITAVQLAESVDMEFVLPSRSVCEQIGSLTQDPIDREIALLRGKGLKFHEIAEAIGMQPAGVRKRWSRMKDRAREIMAQEKDHADH